MHIVCFNLSAITLIAQVPEVKAELESIVPFGDDLSFGPIADVLGPERKRWHDQHLSARFAFSAREIEKSWSSNLRCYDFIRAGKGDIQVWVSRYSTTELCGFSEFLCHVPENRNFEIVDFTNALEEPNLKIFSIGQLGLSALSAGNDRSRICSTVEWQSLISNWKELKAENSSLRTSYELLPKSVSETHFDKELLSYVSYSWGKTIKIISAVLREEKHQNSYPSWDLLYSRIMSNAHAGVIEIRGSDNDPMAEIRLSKVI